MERKVLSVVPLMPTEVPFIVSREADITLVCCFSFVIELVKMCNHDALGLTKPIVVVESYIGMAYKA